MNNTAFTPEDCNGKEAKLRRINKYVLRTYDRPQRATRRKLGVAISIQDSDIPNGVTTAELESDNKEDNTGNNGNL